VEGAAKVKLEVDEKGNVTDAKIAKSSGNPELDEAAVRAARKWKLENSKGSSQGIVAKVDFALEGSERARRAEERKKRREARRKRRQAETATEKKAPVATNSSPRRNEAAAPKPQQPQSPKPPQQPASSNQNRLREALRRP
jgi:TonB family protein